MSKFFKLRFLLPSLIVIVVLFAGFAASYFSSSIYLSTYLGASAPLPVHEVKAFLVTNIKSQSKLEAETLKEDFERSSKYVWHEGDYYYVVHSACEMENDANKIKSSLEKSGDKVEILCVTFSKFTIEEDFSAEQHSFLNECITSFMLNFRQLFDLSVGIETEVYSPQVCQEKLQKLSENQAKMCERYENLFKNTQNNKILALKQYLLDIKNCLDQTQPSLQKIKFGAVQILDIYRALTNEFKNAKT